MVVRRNGVWQRMRSVVKLGTRWWQWRFGFKFTRKVYMMLKPRKQSSLQSTRTQTISTYDISYHTQAQWLMALVIFGPRKWVPVVMHPWGGRENRNLSKSFFTKLNHVEDARKITKYVRIFTFLYSSFIISLAIGSITYSII